MIVTLAASCAMLVAALLGSLGPGPFTAVVPPVDEFFKSLWSTLFVAILAVFAIKSRGDTSSAHGLVTKSRHEVGQRMIDLCRRKAEESGVDPAILEGVLLTENLQRPSWVRQLERWKGRISPAGTYGVMQVRSHKPINDAESIDRAIADFFSGVTISRDEYGAFDDRELRSLLRRYNPDSNFIEVAVNIINEIG
jgi:hypothetical protein